MSATETDDLTDFSQAEFDATDELDTLIEDGKDVLHQLHYKYAGDGRVVDNEKEQVKTRQANSFWSGMNALVRAVKARQAAENERRIERLEEELGIEDG